MNKRKTPKNKGNSSKSNGPITLHPLMPEQAIMGIFKISKPDVARIIASKPGKSAKRNK